jgi:hypothetical protein
MYGSIESMDEVQSVYVYMYMAQRRQTEGDRLEHGAHEFRVQAITKARYP